MTEDEEFSEDELSEEELERIDELFSPNGFFIEGLFQS